MQTVRPSAPASARHDGGAQPSVDLVVPVYNEAASLVSSVERIRAALAELPFDWRVTIADNASSDATPSLAHQLARQYDDVRVLRLEQKGRGRALKAAWSASDADVVAYTDVDLSTGLDALGPMLAAVSGGYCDLAIGSRLLPASDVHRGLKREFISRTYNLLLRLILRIPTLDAQCGFKALRGSIAPELLELVEDGGWFFDTELIVAVQRSGLKILEIPVDWVDDPDSSVALVRTAVEDLRGVARIARQHRRLEWSAERPPVAAERAPLA